MTGNDFDKMKLEEIADKMTDDLPEGDHPIPDYVFEVAKKHFSKPITKELTPTLKGLAAFGISAFCAEILGERVLNLDISGDQQTSITIRTYDKKSIECSILEVKLEKDGTASFNRTALKG